MGGAVSSGESNDELIDNLLKAEYIKSPLVERVLRAVDRGFYFTKEHRHNAYKDLAWKDGNLHISAPCIYSEVMENLRLKEGMSFLNIGSGTGYLSTVAGLILGRTGINHGIEIHPDVVDYARAKLAAFLKSSPAIDLFDFCPPQFVVGNICETLPSTQRYDRIYCGAACTQEDAQLILNLLKVGGISIVPMNDSLLQITRTSQLKVQTKTLLPVSFASLLRGEGVSKSSVSHLPGWNARGLKELCRDEIREILRKTIPQPKPSTENPGGGGETGRKRRRKKRNEQRRENRLLLLQRRRAGGRDARGGRNNALMAISLAMDDGTSSDDTETLRSRSPAAPTNTSTRPNPEPREQGGTGSGDSKAVAEKGMDQSELKTEAGTEEGPGEASKEPSTSTSIPPLITVVEPEEGEAGASGGGNNDEANLQPSPLIENGNSPSSRPRKRTILEQIRQLVRRRQIEREARRESGLAVTENRIEAQSEDDGITEGFWSSDDDTSSSSSSDSDSDVMVLSQDGDGDADEPSAAEQEMDIGAVGQDLPVRRIQRVSLDSSDDSGDFELPPRSPPLPTTQPGQTNIDLEIEELEGELHQPAPLVHHTSIELRDRINLLLLPPPIKHFLNYDRQLFS